MSKPRPDAAERAAELLGVDVFDLGNALRRYAHKMWMREADRVRSYDKPDLGGARRMLWAAEAAEEAWDEVTRARAGEEAPVGRGPAHDRDEAAT